MKIKKLEIVGFKSFVDPTVLNFDHDVTGIVGPNGCGKSNVVDAIKWVMGEQSAQRLRGKAMDDVIFNGSESRGPHGFAEVSITFDNTDGRTPPEYRDYAEINVTRRLDRQGRSDYHINKTPVRLMDVTNLFLGTGVGRRAYSIIEQGRIGYIVSSKPADRRQMIEEAAGVTKFKVRKRAAERKMDQTRQNLVRVGDIVGELETSLASLKRQAQKAERYKKYRAEVRDLELYVSAFKYLELHNAAGFARRRLDDATAKTDGARIALRVREAELESQRVMVAELGQGVEKSQTRCFALDTNVQRLEAEIQNRIENYDNLKERENIAERELTQLRTERAGLLTEQQSLQSALKELEAAESEASTVLDAENEELNRRRAATAEAIEAANNARARVSDCQTRIARAEAVLAAFHREQSDRRVRKNKMQQDRELLSGSAVELTQLKSEIEARLSGLRGGKDASSARREDIELELVGLREEIKESDRNLETMREQFAAKASRLRSLTELHEKFEGVGAGVRALMTRHQTDSDSDGVVGLVADLIDCPPEFTQALAGALGPRLSSVVVKDEESARRAVAFLRGAERGRATLMLQTPNASVLPEGASAPEQKDVEMTIGRLAQLVGCAEVDAGWVKSLLGRFVVVQSLDEALSAREVHPNETYVTMSGEVLEPNGTLTGGAGDDTATHMLELKREMKELDGVVSELENKVALANETHGRLRAAIATRQAGIDAARSEAHDAEIAVVKADKDIKRIASESETLRVRLVELDTELSNVTESLARADEDEALAVKEIEGAKAAETEATHAFGVAESVAQERQEAVTAQASVVTEVHVRAAKAAERVEGDRAALTRLERAVSEYDARESRLQGDVEEGAAQQGRVVAEIFKHREALVHTVREAMNAQEELAKDRERHDESQQSLGTQEAEIRSVRVGLEEMTEEVSGQTMRCREVELEQEHLLTQIDERHRVDLRLVLVEYHARPLPDPATTERVKQLVRLIDRMGEINLTAIEEYEEKSKRYEYLAGQQKDLEDALITLDRAIRQMNRESRRLFKEAFVGINERFKRLYPVLFRGGKAELKLTDPNNLLESGIDIIAQPPGKRLGALELMSGGEKALTAVAMIFAIFQYKPSPFCVLDEVDAPLDEANISRFAQAIRTMTDKSQFIVITHSKRTMEYTDVLYGVTMQQPGVSKLVAVELTGNKRPAPAPEEETVSVVA